MNKKTIFSKDFIFVVIGRTVSVFGNQILRYALPMIQGHTKGNKMRDTLSVPKTLLIFLAIIATWIVAWLLKLRIDEYELSAAASSAYWTSAKLLVWILPSIYIIRRNGQKISDLFLNANAPKVLIWGVGLGGLIVIVNLLAGSSNWPPKLSFSYANILLIAPVFEEFFIRGAIYTSLRRKLSFWIANSLAALLFVALHCPGWYFTGNLADMLLSPIGGALSIFVLGWLFGLAQERGETLLCPIIVHFLNNLTA